MVHVHRRVGAGGGDQEKNLGVKSQTVPSELVGVGVRRESLSHGLYQR